MCGCIDDTPELCYSSLLVPGAKNTKIEVSILKVFARVIFVCAFWKWKDVFVAEIIDVGGSEVGRFYSRHETGS